MSDVYVALDETAGTKVAVKVVRSEDPTFARRLAQEAEALEGFQHPGLVQMLDSGVSGNDAFLVMELVDGPNLANTLANGPRSAQKTAKLGSTLADALAYVHERGIVHRDVKPSNVLLTGDGLAKLADFGIARLVGASTLTATGTTLGTASYMAPEQLENNQVGPSADIWSLGIVLLECLTGRRVYEGTPSEVVGRRLAGPVPIPDDLPVPWKLLLSGMLDHQPECRLTAAQVGSLLTTDVFTTAWDPTSAVTADLLLPAEPHDLTALLPGKGGDATAVVPPDRTLIGPRIAAMGRAGEPSRRSGRAPFIVGAAVLLAIVLGIIWAADTGRQGGTPGTGRTTVPSTTSTTVLTSAAALVILQRDVSSGVAAGTIDSGVGQNISNQADDALLAVAAGNPNQAAADLQAAATAIATLSSSEASLLQSDLRALAGLLGLSAAATPQTTVAPGPGGGPGKGNKH